MGLKASKKASVEEAEIARALQEHALARRRAGERLGSMLRRGIPMMTAETPFHRKERRRMAVGRWVRQSGNYWMKRSWACAVASVKKISASWASWSVARRRRRRQRRGAVQASRERARRGAGKLERCV